MVPQKVLSPLVLPLAPTAARAAARTIPFMTAGEGVGRRSRVASAASALSGPIVVEDVTLQEGGHGKVSAFPALSRGRHRGACPRLGMNRCPTAIF